ncbi:MAG: lipocalin-like domain-containing protein, partial [Cocleimonas sp.]
MGKLTKLSILFIIITGLALALFLSRESNNPNIQNSTATTMPPQSFGRVVVNTDPERLGEVADPNYKISFPKDHYSHDSFDIEWWYLTANLQDKEGNDYGLQWTLFRFRNPNIDSFDGNGLNPNNKSETTESNWNNEHLYMAHASVHSKSKHWFSEKFARGNVGNAGVDQLPFKLFIDDWQWTSTTADLLPAKLNFNAQLIDNSAEISYLNVQLNLSNIGPYVLQGQDGYSIKSGNGKHASHYYSAPFIKIDGVLTMSEAMTSPDISSNLSANDKQTAVKGNAWFDQEWTSQLFDQATLGWDWLSLHLDNGDKIMAFRMRLQGQPDYITGTYINADGSTTMLKPSDIELNAVKLTEVGNKKLPLSWQLKIESKSL